MRKSNKRRLTVHESRKSYASLQKAPCIILEGVWLNALGYHPGDAVDITEKDGMLTITRIDPESASEDPRRTAIREEVAGMTKKERRMMAAALREAGTGYGR